MTYTAAGETEMIQYHRINAMMLNEMQKQERTIREQSKKLDGRLRERLAAIERMIQPKQ